MRLFIYLFFLIASITNVYANTATNVQTLVFFRHGEKPLLDFGQLRCKGLNRAMALPEVLKQKFAKPDYIFAPYPYWQGYYYYVRALVTVEPLAIRLQMPVHTIFYYHEVDKTAEFLIDDMYHSSTIFLAWEHKNIPKVVKKIFSLLGANANVVPNQWPKDDYDSLFVITINWNTKPATVLFLHDYENLNSVSENCPSPYKKSKVERKTTRKYFYFIPAGEQVLGASDQLSCRGLNRALLLPDALNKIAPQIGLFVVPAPEEIAILPEFKRALMTIEPTIISRGGEFIPAGHKDISLIKDKNNYDTTAIVWPKYDLPNIARTLYKSYGGKPSEIPSTVPSRNTIFVISVNKIGKANPEFLQINENIPRPSNNCP